MCGCRDGTELSVVKQAVSSSIRRLYEQIPQKLTLRAPTLKDKRELFRASFPAKDISEEHLHSSPTLGSIVMDDALKFMKNRFDRLPIEQQDCLSSMQLLIRGGVLPLTAERVVAVLHTVFKRNFSNLRDLLREIDKQGFLHSGVEVPIIPEMAYLRDHGSFKVVTNSLGFKERDQLHALAGALETINDAAGIFYIAISLGDLGYVEDEIAVYDEVVRRFGDAAEAALREQVARALYNKGVVLGGLNRKEDAIAALQKAMGFRDVLSKEVQAEIKNLLAELGFSEDEHP